MSSGSLYSEAERRAPEEREAALMAALPGFIARAQKNTAVYRERFRDVDARDITSREALAALPVTAKSALIGEQGEAPPFGGHEHFADAMPRRFYMSPGPIAECDFDAADGWRTAAAFYAAGFRAGMLLHNAFSYHFTPAGFMCDDGARALGGRVFPAGTGNSAQQAQAVARLRPQCYAGTPDFLQTILTRADELGLDATSLTMATVTGGYMSAEARRAHAARGINTLQWYGTADAGCIAFESAAGAPLIVSEGLLVEVAHPVTRRACAAGEKGEVLITNFNDAYPLIRFALGDLSAVVAGVSDCGRTNMRLAGWLGRCDAAVKVRGMFVHPVQVERIIAASGGAITAAQLAVQSAAGGDKMLLRCVPAADAGEEAAAQINEALAAETKLRGEIVFVKEITGALITDEREAAESAG